MQIAFALVAMDPTRKLCQFYAHNFKAIDMTSRIDVFISYKREERAFSERVKRTLIQAGYTAVTDLNINNNEDFGDAIDTMIRTATLTLVLWTKASAASDWVRKEARLARDLEKAGKRNNYLGVMVEDVDLDMPADLRGLQMVDIHDGGLDKLGMARLLDAVGAILGAELKQNTQTAEANSEALAKEWQLYDLARSINVAASYERYLGRYPNGEFANDARRQLGMFTWYLHPFRRGNIPNTLAAMGIVGTIAATIWGASRDPVVLGVEPFVYNALEDERDKALAQVEVLENEKSEAEARATRAADAVGQKESAFRQVKTQINLLQTERDTAITLNEKLAEEKADAEEQVVSLQRLHQREVDRLADEKERLEAALSGSDASRKKLEAEILALKSTEPGEKCTLIADNCVPESETRLDLSGSGFSAVSQLSTFEKLKWLNLTDSKVRDISDFPNLQNLEILLLGGPEVDNVNSLTKLTNLRQLHLWRTSVKNVSSLANLKWLHAVTMPDGQTAGSVYGDSINARNDVQKLIDTWKPN